ncbi:MULTISPECIES: flavin prenyltransferase UbiX [unclassified Thioalkalivibrio]|uniref:flavin prenyltransferase UbiX n=1 Tax=unclassified Thioalkalivibrio TaxID=2621013 RepID=UPI000369B679|nr:MULTISPECIES: flavin prenyltransferase UbiX [unclassified Thioalkalivibrio]PYG03150.1 4-hydroxy-3-polyprenylbenzoate decarboxylase [Thioalkalivibrio sp. ALE21]
MSRRIALALTGASGAPYGLRLLECLVQAGVEVHLMVSKPGQVVLGMETDLGVPGRPAEIARFFSERYAAEPGQIQCYGPDQWTAPVASGSAAPESMVVCPCTTATVSAVATGASRGLIERAADVVLKERRRLILVVRETPFSEIHLENMLRLTRMGAVVMPANPAFYHRPEGLQDLIDFMVARVLDHLQIEHALGPRWGTGHRQGGEDGPE